MTTLPLTEQDRRKAEREILEYMAADSTVCPADVAAVLGLDREFTEKFIAAFYRRVHRAKGHPTSDIYGYYYSPADPQGPAADQA